MGIRLIASDFDGTLRQRGRGDAFDNERIDEWRSRGKIFGVVTGRGTEFPQIAAVNGFSYDFLCCCSGAVVYGADGNIIYEVSGDAEPIFELSRLAVEHLACAISPYLFKDANGRMRFYQCSVCLQDELEAAQMKKEIEQKFSGVLSPFLNGRNIDVAPFGASKAAGVLAAAEYFGVEHENIMSIGNNFNDLTMLHEFGGYAVASAREEIKKETGRVCDGVGELINMLLD